MDPLLYETRLKDSFNNEKTNTPSNPAYEGDSNKTPNLYNDKDKTSGNSEVIDILKMEAMSANTKGLIYQDSIVYINITRLFDLRNYNYFVNSYPALEALNKLFPTSRGNIFTDMRDSPLNTLDIGMYMGYYWDGDLTEEYNVSNIIIDVISDVVTFNLIVFEANNEREVLNASRLALHLLTTGGNFILKLPHGPSNLIPEYLYSLFFNFTESHVINPITSNSWFFIGLNKLPEIFNPFDSIDYFNHINDTEVLPVNPNKTHVINKVPTKFLKFLRSTFNMNKDISLCDVMKLNIQLNV